MQTTLIYIDNTGALQSLSDELPFSFPLKVMYDNIEIDAQALCTGVNVTEITEKGVEISASLHVSSDIYELIDIGIVEAAKATEMPKTPKGFVVCFASDGETTYDIAKRFNVSTDIIQASNNFTETKLKQGDKAIMLV